MAKKLQKFTVSDFLNFHYGAKKFVVWDFLSDTYQKDFGILFPLKKVGSFIFVSEFG